MQLKSLGGVPYFVTFMIDYSRKVRTFLLKYDDMLLDAFKELHAKVVKETRKQLKAIRSNDGGELKDPFEIYRKDHEIRLKKTL